MIRVYGASDDLIEIEGDINEEFYASDDEPNYLAFHNGVVVMIKYIEGMWKMMHISDPHSLVEYVHTALDADSDNYSDIIEMVNTNPHSWVVYGHQRGTA